MPSDGKGSSPRTRRREAEVFKLIARRWPDIPLTEIRKRSRLLVIDDEDLTYLPLFVRDGYTIEKWDDVKRLSELEEGNFDLILLDLSGVGKLESQEEGLGLLKHIRSRCPAQIVIVYSSKPVELRHQDSLKLADAVLSKTANYIDFKNEIDRLLQDRFSLGFFVSRIITEASRHKIDREDLRRAAEKAILAKNTKKLDRFLTGTGMNRETIDRILTIADMAIGILKLWKV
jgi:CheY-like chemotaxis protein